MPGAIGAVATLLNTVASWLMSEDGYAEFSKRQKLTALRKEADAALARSDWDAHKKIVSELKRLSVEP